MVFGDELRQEGMLQAAVLSYMAAAAPAAKQALTPNANWTMAVAGFSGMIAPNDKVRSLSHWHVRSDVDITGKENNAQPE
eukprot:944698-Rhodomonas_salina.1